MSYAGLKWRWEHHWGRDRYVSVDFRNVHFFRVFAMGHSDEVETEVESNEVAHLPDRDVYFFNDDRHGSFGIGWGDKYGDPVWEIAWVQRVPAWLGRRLRR